MADLCDRYYNSYMFDIDDPDMAPLVDECVRRIKISFDSSLKNIERIAYDVLITSKFPKVDCCRFAALVSLVLDEMGYHRYYEVYEGYATPPKATMTQKEIISDQKMLSLSHPMSNHVWVEAKGQILESFNGDHALHRKANAMIYPYHQKLVD